MNQPKRRRYIDVISGKMRTLLLFMETDRFVKWHKELPECLVTLWKDEDGSIVQIPDSAWLNHGNIWEAPKEIKDNENN